MKQQDRYIQWQNNTTNSLDEKISEIMKHWQSRYELGSAVLITDSPTTTLKNVQKQWRKLTRQAQKIREQKQSAEDILSITRTISRMQRITFTAKSPEEESNASFYILKSSEASSLPAHCFTLYSTSEVPKTKVLDRLAPDALVVLYLSKQNIPYFKNKSFIEERLQTEETTLLNWLSKHAIDIEELEDDIEKTNEALDTLLSSNNLQAEFLHKTKLFFHTMQLAQPIKLSIQQIDHLKALEQLEKHVRILSPSYLSDHIIDTQSDDSFLLRDAATGKTFTLNSLKEFIAQQYKAGRHNLAAALEQQAGFIRI